MQSRSFKSLIKNALVVPLVFAILISGCSKSKKVIGAHETKWKQQSLIVTYCCSAPPKEESIKQAVEEGFTMIPAWQETLDFAAKHDMKVMLEHGLLTPKIADDPQKLKELEQLIEKVKDHPALECYYLYDEPKAIEFPAIAKLVSFIRERDPKHFCFVNLLPIHGVPGYGVPLEPGVDPSKTYMKFLKNYIETVKPDLLSYDYYNFLRKPSGEPEDLPGYFSNLFLVREAAKSAQLPFINIIQACTIEKNMRLPDANEMRWQVYTTLAYGGKGISYFLYWGPKKNGGIYQDGKATPLLEPIAQLNKEINVLSPILMDLTSEQVYNTDPLANANSAIPDSSPVHIDSPGKYVLGLFSQNGELNHFMIVNSDYREPVSTKFRVNARLKELDCSTGTWKDVGSTDDGFHTITIQPGDGRLFKMQLSN